MTVKISLEDLERVAGALSIRVSYDDLKTSRGGSCRVRESRRIIINKHLRSGEKIGLLARELAHFGVDGVEMPENVRKKIEHEAEHRTES
jgi:hypothetical protein